MSKLPRVAAVTMVRNEGRMLQKWVDHYGGQLGNDHLVVIDDNSDDGSTDRVDCKVKRIRPITGEFEPARMRIVSEVARKLLRRHDAVVFADADEFIVPDPERYAGLLDFVAAHRDVPAVGVMCLNVVHHLAAEGPLDYERPFLDQRQVATFVPLFCKPAVKFVKNSWAAGSHGLAGATFQVSPELYMFHMKFADRGHLERTAAERHRLMVEEGKAGATSWRFTSDEMVALLDEVNAKIPADAAELPPFVPAPKRIAEIAQTFPGGLTRATGGRQVSAMRARPPRRIPPRFRGLV